MRVVRIGIVAALALVASCAVAPRPVVSSARLGDAMDEAAQHFDRAGRAAIAGRWDLAKDDLQELDEIFEEGRAASPWLGKPELARRARRFQTEQLAMLRTAVKSHDHDAFAYAVAETARACNECHKAASQAYIEISEQSTETSRVIENHRRRE